MRSVSVAKETADNGAADTTALPADVRPTDALLETGALQRAIFDSANFSSIATDAKGPLDLAEVLMRVRNMLEPSAVDIALTTQVSLPQGRRKSAPPHLATAPPSLTAIDAGQPVADSIRLPFGDRFRSFATLPPAEIDQPRAPVAGV